MRPITLSDVAHATAGQILTGDPNLRFSEICTDTRKLTPGCLFIAIKGDTFDAHDFLPKAAEAGAVAALAHTLPSDGADKPLHRHSGGGLGRGSTPPTDLHAQALPAPLPPGLALVKVDATRPAMGRLANFIRAGLPGKVIGIGGSNGKTSTKHLVDSVLKTRFRGTRSDKSFNNDIGVPLTLFAAGQDDDFVVVELGTNHPGEMTVLTQIAQPDIGIIMNAAPEHLEGLGSIDGVRREEASLVDGLKPDGLLIINGDDTTLLEYASTFAGRRLTFGWSRSCDLFATDVRCELGGTTFKVNGRWDVRVPLPGRHFAVNALAAIAAGREMGLTDAEIARGLAHSTSPDMRMQVLHRGRMTILNDAYNANPASMSAALQTLANLETPGRRVAILGGMRELGPDSAKLHAELGAEAARSQIDLLVCVGDLARDIATGARQAGMKQVQELETAEAAKTTLPPLLQPTDTLLLKGSRGVRVEKVLEAFAGDSQPTTP